VEEPIKVLLGNRSQTVRLLLTSLLRDDDRFEIVAEVPSGAEMLERSSDADLVVVDVVLEDRDGFSVIEDIRGIRPDLPVVVFAAVDPPYLRAEADARGASGYFTHETAPAKLLDGFVAAVRSEIA